MKPERDSVLQTPGLALLVLAVIVALYGLDRFLARAEQSELQTEAQTQFSEGQRLLVGGKPHQSLQHLQRACSLEHANQEYELALATAELADDSINKARETLNDLLQNDSNDARANLLMARVMARENPFQRSERTLPPCDFRCMAGKFTANGGEGAFGTGESTGRARQ